MQILNEQGANEIVGKIYSEIETLEFTGTDLKNDAFGNQETMTFRLNGVSFSLTKKQSLLLQQNSPSVTLSFEKNGDLYQVYPFTSITGMSGRTYISNELANLLEEVWKKGKLKNSLSARAVLGDDFFNKK